MKIICIGRNYREHIKELHHEVPATPVFFLKPDTSLLIRNRPFFLPDFSKEIHYEVELVMKIGKVGKNIQKKFAHTYYDEIGIGIDFTARDLQNISKQQGLPWLIAKGFDNAAPLGKFIPKEQLKDQQDIHFHLNLNGTTVQKSSSKEMIFSFDDIISYISHFITLKTGDLIFTGTPSGVGPVKVGDKLEGFLEDEKMLKCEIR
ncbi:MAG: fumarylacetoacetate hydrolase family protein [Bacteroidetes bacterium]|nr:fumarylacetoacetate hydrolase family protein [Bacteroidota bacterium]